jgi:uncharacterized membrane protein
MRDFEQQSEQRQYEESSAFWREGYRPVGEQQPTYEQPAFVYRPYPGEKEVAGAVLSYVLGWFSGLLFTLFAWQDRYVRFHAVQSLLFFGSISVLDIGMVFMMGSLDRLRFFEILPPGRILIPFFLLAFFLINAVAFVGWLVAMFQAARGKYYRLPIVGAIAARCIGGDATVK